MERVLLKPELKYNFRQTVRIREHCRITQVAGYKIKFDVILCEIETICNLLLILLNINFVTIIIK